MMMLNFDYYEINNEKLDGLFSVIASYVKEMDMNTLKRGVLACLNRGSSFVGTHDKEQPDPLDILQKEDIRILGQIDSWKEMTQTASTLLLSRGVIQNDYIQEMIHLVDEYGPYVLPTNSVVVARAKPEHGAFRLGLSLLICHEDVYPDEVPAVRYLFILLGAARDRHLSVLHEILQLGRNSTLLTQLDVRTSAVEVYRTLLHAFS